MQKQEVPPFMITQPSQMPLHRQLLDGLRRYAFATVATLVVVAYLGVLYLFSHRYAQDTSDLDFAALPSAAIESTAGGTPPGSPMRSTGLAAADSVGHILQPRVFLRDSSVFRSRQPSDSMTSTRPVSASPARAVSVDTGTSGHPPSSTRQASSTPARAAEVGPVPVEKGGHGAKQQPRRASGTRPPQAQDTAETPGTLLVTSQPPGATVLLNGEALGITPLTATEVAPGLHKIALHSTGYAPYATRVVIKSEETSTLHGQLSVPVGPLEVWIEPKGAIYIDDVLHRQGVEGSYTTQLPVGPLYRPAPNEPGNCVKSQL